jgi:hypothetical protein
VTNDPPRPSVKLGVVDAQELTGAYWRHYELAHVGKDEARAEDFFWAWEAVDEIAHGHVTDTNLRLDPLDLIVQLADRAPNDEKALAYLGAGPVEDYLLYGDPDIRRVEQAAEINPRFRVALRCAWFDAELPNEDAARLRRFGPPL